MAIKTVKRDGKSYFKMYCDNEIEEYRYNSFWDKEPELIAWQESFKNGEAFFDIGANIGVYSLLCASLHPDSQIYAFEPMPKNFIRLMQNVELNGFKNMHCFNVAIHHWTHLDNIYIPENVVGRSGAQVQAPKDEAGKDFDPVAEYLVQHWSLCDFTAGLKKPRDFHIKIDVDGHEYNVLQGMKALIKQRIPKSILVEFNSEAIRDMYSVFIKKSGYTINNSFNQHPNHSRIRRKKEGIKAENIIFTRI